MLYEKDKHKVATEDCGYRYDYVRLRPEEQIDMHSHADWELDYIIKGGGHRTLGGDTKPFGEGDLVLVPPQVPHCWHFEPHATSGDDCIENITIRISDAWLDTLSSTFPDTAESIESLRSHTAATVFDQKTVDLVAQQMLAMRTERGIERLSSMLRIIGRLSSSTAYESIGGGRPITLDERLLDDVRVYVACNFGKRITLEDIARHVGKSRTNFCRWYKAHTGTTFFDFLNRQRVDWACRMLTNEPDMSISEIAMKCGFGDIPYFFRVFHNITASTPNTYRQQHRKA